MTYKNFKDALIKTEQIDNKGVKKFIICFGLLCFFLVMSLAMVVAVTLNTTISAIVLAMGCILFLVSLDYFVEDLEVFNKVRKLSKHWYIGGIVFIVVFIFLRLSYFV